MDTLAYFKSQIEDIISSLDQVDALLTVATYIDITELPSNTAFNYLWVTTNLLSNAKLMCERMLEV